MTTYHVGFLARDREHDELLHRTSAALYQRAKRGEIHLLQQRSGFCAWHYFYVETAE